MVGVIYNWLQHCIAAFFCFPIFQLLNDCFVSEGLKQLSAHRNSDAFFVDVLLSAADILHRLPEVHLLALSRWIWSVAFLYRTSLGEVNTVHKDVCTKTSLVVAYFRIWHVVADPHTSAWIHASSIPKFSNNLPSALYAAITVCSSPSLERNVPLRSSLVSTNCTAFSYKAMSKVITVGCSSPVTSLQL